MSAPANVSALRSGRWARLHARATAPVDGLSLAVFRVLFGVLLSVTALRYFANGWIEQLFEAPRFFFTYEGFEWVRPWPHPFMHVHFAAMAALGALVAAGLFYRAALFAYGALFTYAHLIDKTNYLNHYYLLSLLCALFLFVPLHHVLSFDAWRARRRGRPLSPLVPAWSYWVPRAQLAIVYVYAGIAKLSPDWLLDALPLRLWLRANADLPLLGGLLAAPWAAYVFSWAAAIFDLTVPLWLSWRRTRAAAFGVLCVFHVLTSVLFPIGIFPWLMTLGAMLFFAPPWPRRVFAKFCKAADVDVDVNVNVNAPIQSPRSRRSVLGFSMIAAWFSIQLAVPARVLLAPPDLLWHEDGFRFGWRVMVMEKTAVARFRVVTKTSGAASARTFEVSPKDFLTPLQVRQMSTQPDLIVAFARFLGREHERRLGEPVAVYADVFASLNGRPSQRLIADDLDLTAHPYRAASAYVSPRIR